jgi:hypothetical protein
MVAPLPTADPASHDAHPLPPSGGDGGDGPCTSRQPFHIAQRARAGVHGGGGAPSMVASPPSTGHQTEPQLSDPG